MQTSFTHDKMNVLAAKTDIIRRLQGEILALQRHRKTEKSENGYSGLGQIENSFPGAVFPMGVVHEFTSGAAEAAAATNGFIAGLLSKCLPQNGVYAWVGTRRTVFPPTLQLFNIDPGSVFFIDVPNPKDALWVIEEALKCEGLTAVIGEISELTFTESRRLQLAVEKSRVTGFIHRYSPRTENVTACVSRWKIQPLASELEAGMPGIGLPRWNVQLLKVRNGKPGTWQVEWCDNSFRYIQSNVLNLPQIHKRKTG